MEDLEVVATEVHDPETVERDSQLRLQTERLHLVPAQVENLQGTEARQRGDAGGEKKNRY